MRVFLPSTFTGLQGLLDGAGHLADAPLPAYAVTPALREWYAEGDDDELDHVALTLAAQASLRLLDADQDTVRRRVVVVAEVPDSAVSLAAHVDRAAVKVAQAVRLVDVKAVHVDDEAAVPDIADAVDAVVEADLGSQDALFRVEQAEGHELMWFATQEIGFLLELG